MDPTLAEEMDGLSRRVTEQVVAKRPDRGVVGLLVCLKFEGSLRPFAAEAEAEALCRAICMPKDTPAHRLINAGLLVPRHAARMHD